MSATAPAAPGRWLGAAIPSVMGAIWIAGGLRALGRAHVGALCCIVLLAAAFLAADITAMRRRPAPPGHPERGRLFGLALAFEGIGCTAALVLAQVLGRPDLVAPLIAIVVGLHFCPLARAFGRPALYRVAAIMVAGGALALVGYTGEMRVAVAAFGAGIALWSGAVEMAWPLWRDIPARC